MPSPNPVRREWKRGALYASGAFPKLTQKQIREVADALPQVRFDATRRRSMVSFIRHERALYAAETAIGKYPSNAESKEALSRVRDAAARLHAEVRNMDELARDALCHALGKAPAQYSRGENKALPPLARGRSRVDRLQTDVERLTAEAATAQEEFPQRKPHDKQRALDARRNLIDRILQRYMSETGEAVSRSDNNGGALRFAAAVASIVDTEIQAYMVDADIRAWIEGHKAGR